MELKNDRYAVSMEGERREMKKKGWHQKTHVTENSSNVWTISPRWDIFGVLYYEQLLLWSEGLDSSPSS